MKIEVEQRKLDALVDAISELAQAAAQDVSRDPECTPSVWDAEVKLANAIQEIFA